MKLIFSTLLSFFLVFTAASASEEDPVFKFRAPTEEELVEGEVYSSCLTHGITRSCELAKAFKQCKSAQLYDVRWSIFEAIHGLAPPVNSAEIEHEDDGRVGILVYKVADKRYVAMGYVFARNEVCYGGDFLEIGEPV